MGVSTNGIVCYGVPIDENTELPWNDEEKDYEDYEEWFYDYLGWNKTYDDFPNSREYWKAKIAFTSLSIFSHCSCDCMMYILGIKSSERVASRGYPETLPANLDSLITEEAKQELLNFIERLNDDFPELLEKTEPSWLLVSMWC